jgi:Cu+-exporting ATPase
MGRIPSLRVPEGQRARRGFTMSKDPVCGMTVDEKSTTDKSEYQGRTFYFCSPGCKKSFDKEPHKYAGGASHVGHH